VYSCFRRFTATTGLDAWRQPIVAGQPRDPVRSLGSTRFRSGHPQPYAGVDWVPAVAVG
jgi:hypothetical protein